MNRRGFFGIVLGAIAAAKTRLRPTPELTVEEIWHSEFDELAGDIKWGPPNWEDMRFEYAAICNSTGEQLAWVDIRDRQLMNGDTMTIELGPIELREQ